MRSGFRSRSGVSSTQSRPRASIVVPSMPMSRAMEVPIGFGRAGERREPASAEKRCRERFRHLRDFAERDRGARDAANRSPRSARSRPGHPTPPPTVRTPRCGREDHPAALPRRDHAGEPWCANAADEHQAGVGRFRWGDRDLGIPDLVLTNHAFGAPSVARPAVP